ncbi:hypothetical protein CHL78_009455 [Romboutsia weinsteinii]|uniref:Uncharacterized protein n=1 Tax=Romboutsia weinsteinii TaxID=2020949 RepID=A0A371J3R6_9FIRM|nr:hypothetical protein [Romboutsia weinsteinii]RDY27430.1 hypothetical protein CHL78_009455 [Romboutsia weinsteinii]
MKILRNMLNNAKQKLPFGSEECGRFLKETYKDSVNEVAIINEEMYNLIEQHDEIVGQITKLESEKKIIEHTLQSELKYCETGFCKERKITWKSSTKCSIDTKRLKSDLPEIAEKYSKTTVSRTFRIHRG